MNGQGPANGNDADELLSSTYDNLHGLLMKKGDIEFMRTPEGKKCRLGEGGFGVVYKAVMNGVDEVAIKLVKVSRWLKESGMATRQCSAGGTCSRDVCWPK